MPLCLKSFLCYKGCVTLSRDEYQYVHCFVSQSTATQLDEPVGGDIMVVGWRLLPHLPSVTWESKNSL